MKKRILTLTLVLCMLLSILPVTAMAAANSSQDLLTTLENTTFGYAYDTQRSVNIPTENNRSFTVDTLVGALDKDGKHMSSYNGEWKLHNIGTYTDFVNDTTTTSAYLSKIVTSVISNFTNLKEDTILIHELKKGNEHVAYGVVIAFSPKTDADNNSGYAVFLGDTFGTNVYGAGYFLSMDEKTVGAGDTIKYPVYANMIATDIARDISLSVSGTHDFGSATAGYTNTDYSLSVTVKNLSNSATGALSVASTNNNFEVTPASLGSIASQNGTQTFTVTPKAGLAAGTYTATITVSGDNVTPKSFSVKFTVDASNPSISLSQTTALDFGSKVEGYSAAPDAQTVTVTSTGNTATGALSVALTGENAAAFELSKTSIDSIAKDAQDTFTVRPKTGLAVGTYTATVTVRGTGVAPQSFNVKFAVSEAPKPSVALDTTSYTFNLTEGYTVADVTPLTVTISNTGSGAATGLTLASGTSTRGEFAITYQGGTEIPTGESVSFTVKPSSVKTAGTYSDTVVIRGTNFTELVLNLTLTVTAKPSEPVYTPSYAVAAASAEHGTVALSTKNAYAGSAVTVTVTPDEGYALSSLTAATRTGASVALTDLGSGRYRFTMPASDVTVTAAFAAGEKTARFVDVPVGSTFFDAVEWAAAQGITTGTTDTTFSPANACTRGQIVTFLWRAFGSPEPKTAACPFTDVTEDSFCYKAVLWAVENGITTGTTDTTFSPNVPCSRAQAVTLLYRAVGSPAVSGTSGFPDVPAGAYCGSAVTWAVEKGVTTGTTDGLFAPGVNCSRGQIVAFLCRALFAQK